MTARSFRSSLVILTLVGCHRHPDVLLITMDTRADALGVYGRSPSPTPTLDSLADKGVRVDEAVAVAPLTLPAHVSILTGLYPDRHGVRDNDGFRLDDSFGTLAEVFSQAGYHAGAFVAAAVLDRAFGLDQGFDVYSDGFDLTTSAMGTGVVAQWPADDVRARAEAWLTTLAEDDPFFAWVHFYDPHQPLVPPGRFLARFPDPYMAEVAFVDKQVGLLLRTVGLRDRPVIIAVIGDHGESRGEHGEPTHGILVYRSTMRVPFILSGPGVPEGMAIEGPISQVDLAPTLLDLAGIRVPDGMDGASLVTALHGGPAPDHPVYGESMVPRLQYGFSDLRLLAEPEVRCMRAPRDEAFRWREDPEERIDVASSEAGRTCLEHLDGFLADRTFSAQKGPLIDDGLRSRLEALGYVAGPAPRSPTADDLPDPKDQPDMALQFEQMMVMARTRPPTEGIPTIEAYLERFPHVGRARMLLSRALELSGRPDEALEVLSSLAPDDPQVLVRQGDILLVLGRVDEAEEIFRGARVVAPSHPSVFVGLGEVARRRGDFHAAVALADDGLLLSPSSSRLHLLRGACRLELGDLGEAEADLLEVLQVDPENRDVHFLLGTVLAREGRIIEALPHFQEQVRRTPERALAQTALGMAFYAGGDPDSAMGPLEEARRIGGAGAQPVLLLTDIALRRGEAMRAMALVAEARRLEPESQQVAEMTMRVQGSR